MSQEEELESTQKRDYEQKKNLEANKKAEEQLKTALRVALDDVAYARIMNVKLAKQQLFLIAAQNVLSLYKQMMRKITDKELLFVLHRIREKTEKEVEIRFERK